MKKVLVTGVNGLIAGQLVKTLARRDEIQLLGTSRTRPSDCSFYDFFSADLVNSPSNLDFAQGSNTVVHCAGQTGLSAKSEIFTKNNTVATKNLVDWCIQNQVKNFIFLSTPSMYMAPVDQEGITEEQVPQKVLTSYAKSKMACEAYLEQHKDRFDSIIILRPGTVFGVGNTNLKRAICKMREGRKVISFAREHNFVSVTSLQNMTDVLEFLVDNPRKGFGIYNFCDEGPLSLGKTFLEDYFKQKKIAYKKKTLPFDPFFKASLLVQKIYSLLAIEAEPFLSPYIVCNLGKNRTLSTVKFKRDFDYVQTAETARELEKFCQWLES